MVGDGVAGVAEILGEDGGGALFVVGEFGMGVEVFVDGYEWGVWFLEGGVAILCDECGGNEAEDAGEDQVVADEQEGNSVGRCEKYIGGRERIWRM